MVRDEKRRTTPTRREYLLSGAAVGAGLFAGCVGGAGSSDESSDTEERTTPETATATATDSASTTTADASYTVSMAPVGDVTFESVPERWAAYDGGYADMAVALGRADGLTAVGGVDRYYTDVYDALPGVSVDRSRLESNGDLRTKEQFYALDNDVHLFDPQMLVNWFDWSERDVDEIADNVAPFVGNLIFRRSDEWHDYRYYALYEAFEVVADLFRERDRYEAFVALHDEFLTDIQSRLPPESERPNVFLTYEATNEPETFSPYRLDDAGTSKKQWRDLGVHDALAGTDIDQLSTTERGELDYENLLEIDPEVILVRGHERKSPAEFRDVVLEYMRNHPVGRELSAVRNGRVYRGGYLYQGPIHNLFLTERAAQQLFPDEFGAVTGEETLFDRGRVADIVSGEF